MGHAVIHAVADGLVRFRFLRQRLHRNTTQRDKRNARQRMVPRSAIHCLDGGMGNYNDDYCVALFNFLTF